MGDFENVFGAGADADDIIDGYNREYLRASENETECCDTATDDQFEAEGQQNELSAWRASISARGYTPGPRFSSFEELSEWDKENKRPHIRRRNSDGFEVYFTDNVDRVLSLEQFHRDNRQPSVSRLMFRTSGAHTLDQFRKKAVETLTLQPEEQPVAQLQNSAWLVICAIEDGALREDIGDIKRCATWLRSLVNFVEEREGKIGNFQISDALRLQIARALRLQYDDDMLHFKGRRLRDDGQVDNALDCFARARNLAPRTTRQMSEKRTRLYAETIFSICENILKAEACEDSAKDFLHMLDCYSDLGLFKGTRLHWNILSLAIDARNWEWLDIHEFLVRWRPDVLHIGESHRNEAEAALAKLKAIIPSLAPHEVSAARAFLSESERSP